MGVCVSECGEKGKAMSSLCVSVLMDVGYLYMECLIQSVSAVDMRSPIRQTLGTRG